MDARSDSLELRRRCCEVVSEYALSVGRGKVPPEALEGLSVASLASLALSCQDYLRYGREVDAVTAGVYPAPFAVMVRQTTPRVLIDVGCENLPMLHTQRHILNELAPKDPTGARPEFHGLSVLQVKLFAEALDRPCAVMDNRAGKEGVVLVLDMADSDGLPVIMPVRPSGTGQYMAQQVQTNFVLSAYGKNAFESYLDAAAREGRMLFLDDGRTEKLLANSGLRLPGSCRSYNGIVQRSARLVKPTGREGETARSPAAAGANAQRACEARSATRGADPPGRSR